MEYPLVVLLLDDDGRGIVMVGVARDDAGLRPWADGGDDDLLHVEALNGAVRDCLLEHLGDRRSFAFRGGAVGRRDTRRSKGEQHS